MSHVFISYSHKDTEMMKIIRERLEDDGLIVWTDENLNWGTPSWVKSVEGAIRNASAMVVLLSPDSNASTWVDREISMAELLKIPIFPILIRGEDAESIPLRLVNYQYIRYDADDFSEKLKQLKANLKRTRTQAVAQAQAAETRSSATLRELADELQSDYAEDRILAIQEMVRMNNKRAVPYLVSALENETRSKHVIIALIQALNVFKDERAIDALAAHLGNDDHLKYTDKISDYARRALMAIGTSEAEAKLGASMPE
ncbi:MAG: toll/interleukin-1 receptor domain-containing protein [Anaerolineae bacterium]|nr:toll/interleukin-1 receptor domain-containing protein [Anaerolineae bacterium]